MDNDVFWDDNLVFNEEFDVSQMPPQLQKYWLGPKGSARVGGWGSDGSFTKCTVEMRKEGIPGRMIKGVCGNLYKHATGHGPTAGKHKHGHKYLQGDVMNFADNPLTPYGDVTYADPGYQADGKKRYPINTPGHIRAAWSYINMPKNASKYAADDLAKVRARIEKAMAGAGIGQAAALVAAAEVTGDVRDAHPMTEGDESWEGTLVVEGVESGDGRLFGLGSLDWAALPLPLMYQPANSGGHNDSIHVGEITNAARRENQVYGWGHVFASALAGEHADGIRHMLGTPGKPSSGGVSVDVDKVKDADVEMVYADGGDDGTPGVFSKPETTIFHRGRIRGATLVAFPAFVEAKLHLTGDTLTASGDCGCAEDQVLVAAGHTITLADVPPAEWFERPTDVQMYGALTVTDEGRVFGRLAPSNTTHRSVKRKVPMRTVDYSRWMNKETIVAGGSRVVTGVITMGCGHAATEHYGTLNDRKEHYDNSCSIAANVRIGEDADGVWVAGALRHGVSADQVATMMGCQLSGDWQSHPDRPGVTEFIAALLVPVPGFPEARSQASVQYQDGVIVASSVPVHYAEKPHEDGDYGTHRETLAAVAAAKKIIIASVGLDPATRKRQIMASLREI